MKYFLTKILFITLITTFLVSCNAVKRVPENDYLLEKNQIFVDSTKSKDPKLYNQLYQKPNTKLLGIPFRLHLFNLTTVNKDSTYQAWLKRKPNREKRMINLFSKKQVDRLGVGLSGINEWIKKAGEPPSIVDESKIKRSIKRLQAYYWHNGWFNIDIDYKLRPEDGKRATVDYYVSPFKPYFIDSIITKIDSRVADSIYQKNTQNSTIISGKQYKTLDIDAERERLTSLFRNSGLYHFEKEYIKFNADTVNTDHKVNLNLLIKDRQITNGDSTARIPFKVHSISKVNIFTDYSFLNRNKKPADSIFYKGYNIYSYDRLKYTRKAITNSILITPGEIFRDRDRTLTYNQINNLKVFKYPNIRYDVDPNDPTGKDLIANVLLTPRKKYSANVQFDVSTSNIQAFGVGFGGSLLIRNVFRGAELLEISARGSIGSSKDAVDGSGEFFDISEVGVDFKLSFPKIIFPINTNKIIPKYMSPTSNIIFGINAQQNIGLDKQNASGIFNYQWKPSNTFTHQIDIINAQYVRNLNTGNYFNVYQNSFAQLNDIAREVLDPQSPFFVQPGGSVPNIGEATLIIPGGANGFIQQSLGTQPDPDLTTAQTQEIQTINERRVRLTEDNLIFGSNYTFTKNNKESLYDEEYSRFSVKLELTGNILNAISNLTGLNKNSNDRFEVFGVEFSQYVKTELNYVKHWDLGRKNVLAFRATGGIAIPYGNANNIPFARSFFGGGPNDNRAWSAYDLGPGSSGSKDEFNEANMKIAFNMEYRYNILGSLNGAFFIDAGNIWNVLDNVEDEAAVFSRIDDIQEIAVGSGLGLRYDFDFFILRLDVGFKTFNPANNKDQRWFKGYNFSEAVYNVGINYPF
ncbi:BamA/TamA family outer membrane protein [Aquimarina sp. 2201CG5-10]|uniref:translocation and assembly module lipoprotein TamL n=1 Tax=Aquimarina callyspongiae TaxID=3098150 RepID=UPI002AB4EBB6|nr:BamA/TamA family outer membrane protein [Aquimarina sp. 2201CG5-10]MDY8138818.1 BamA/TamA family outer membrane protein [Aquimarina sp. 2201CG5-10]